VQLGTGQSLVPTQLPAPAADPGVVSSPRCLEGPALPPCLRDVPQPPERLYLYGELARGPAVAVVGTRDATPEAVAFARKLSSELGRAGVVVVSGGAKGIDRAAHEGALSAGGSTVVVAPASLERPFPEEHAELFRRIVAGGGAYVSTAAPGEPAARGSFFERNAYLVALSQSVVVVEAPRRSGARNTAAWARKLSRPLWVVPAVPWNRSGRGCIEELRRGARPLASARELLADLVRRGLHAVAPEWQPGDGEAALAPQVAAACADGDDETRVLVALGVGADHPDAIAHATGLAIARVQRAIFALTLRGALVPHGFGRVALVP
jgi:DNA processing protein